MESLRQRSWRMALRAAPSDRSRRTSLVANLGIVVLTLVGCDVMNSEGSPAHDKAQPSPAEAPKDERCGSRYLARGPAAGFVMTGSFPARAPLSGDQFLQGTVTIVNSGGRPVMGTAAPSPDVFVVREGMIVAVPVPVRLVAASFDLPPGGRQTFDAFASLRRCSDGARLDPGEYELFAVYALDVRADRGAQPVTVTVEAGPLALALG